MDTGEEAAPSTEDCWAESVRMRLKPLEGSLLSKREGQLTPPHPILKCLAAHLSPFIDP